MDDDQNWGWIGRVLRFVSRVLARLHVLNPTNKDEYDK